MFCPKCGEQMVIRDEHYYCDDGEMYLSEFVSSALQKAFPGEAEIYEDDAGIGRLTTNRPWFCPLDSTQLTGHETPLVCSQCRGVMSASVLYQLIERHPHRSDEF